MATRIAIIGQLRSPGLLLRIVDDATQLMVDGYCDEVIVSTWATELDRVPWLAKTLAAYGVEVRSSDQIAVDTYRNYRRQQRLFDIVLSDCRPDDVVVKIRTDWIVKKDHLRALCAIPAPTSGGTDWPAITRGKVRVPWWSTRVPFHVADESVAGYAEDLQRYNPYDGRLALADPHAGRYLPHLATYMPALQFIADKFLPYIAQSQPDSVEVVRALGGPSESPLDRWTRQQLGPFRFELTTMALDLPSYQQALACYVRTVDSLFEVFNPTPGLDQFIERHGPWSHSTPDVFTSGDPFASPDPISYLPEYLANVARGVPEQFEAFHQAMHDYRVDPAKMLMPVDAGQAERDACELDRRVSAFRAERFVLAGAAGLNAPVELRQLALDKDNGPLFRTLDDVYEHARRLMADDAWLYLSGGSGAEQTLSANENAYSRWTIRPRQLTGTVEVDTSTVFLGIPLAAPILTAPVGSDVLFHPDGQRAIVRAAERCGIAPVVAEASYWSLEVAAAETAGPKIMQLHALGTFEKFLSITRRIEDSGFDALCVTVDCPTLGWRERSARAGYSTSEELYSGNHSDGAFAQHLHSGKGSDWTWDTLAKVATEIDIPLIVKGILTPEDATRCVEAGAKAIVVSNHGGRQLDGAPATLDQLPDVVAAVGTRASIALDGGVRRGTDVLKALGLGASVVLVGRPVAMGLGAAGEGGAHRVLELLIEELRLSMLLAGCSAVADVRPSLLQSGRWS